MKQTHERWEDETSDLDGWEIEDGPQGAGSLWRLAAVLLATWGWILFIALMVIDFGELM